MEKLKRFKFRVDLKKIIFFAVMVISMAAFFIFPFSADSYRPVSFNLVSWADNINTHVQYSYSPNGSMQVSAFGSDPSTDYRMNSPYKVYGVFDSNSFYFPGATFFNASGIRKNIVFNLYFGFQYYFDILSFDFYMLLPESGDRSFTVSYLDSDNQFVYGNVTLSALRFDSLVGYFSHSTYSSYFSQAFKDYVNSGSSYYTDVSGITHYHDNTSVKYYLFKVHVSFDNLNKTPINFLSFYLNFNTYSSSVVYPYIKPYFYFPDPNLNAFILQSDIETYTEILNQQQTIINQNDEIIDNLEIINGEPSSENQEKLDELQELETTIDVISENIDIIHQAEQLPTLPFTDSSAVLPVPQNGETDSYNGFFYTFFTQFPLIQQIILSGGVCLIFYTLMRRV